MRGGRINPRKRAVLQGGDSIGSGLFIALDPAYEARRMGKKITDAMDPSKAPSKVRTLADMTPEERAAILAQYSRKP